MHEKYCRPHNRNCEKTWRLHRAPITIKENNGSCLLCYKTVKENSVTTCFSAVFSNLVGSSETPFIAMQTTFNDPAGGKVPIFFGNETHYPRGA